MHGSSERASSEDLELSVVVVGTRPAPELFERLGPGLERGQVEVVVCGEGAAERIAARPGVVTASAPAAATVPRLRALGAGLARAPLVAITEDFCVPAPGWAEALLAGWRELGEPAAVGGPVGREDGAAAEWALTLREYGPFLGRTGGRHPVTRLAPINVAYRRASLVEAMAGEAELFEVEVDARLRAAGGDLWWLPEALMWDRHRGPLADAARAQFFHGRLYGGRFAPRRRAGARVLRAALTPALPFVLFLRAVRAAFASGYGAGILRAMPALGLLVAAWSLGEGVGLLAGPGDSLRRWRTGA